MSEMWNAIAEEFSDLTDVVQVVRVGVRLTMAALLGGVLGYEREQQGKQAGLRTHMLVAVGAALFVLVPIQAGMSDDGISRVLQGLLAGVGFLGAGTILHLHQKEDIRGLTTAAGIWFTAAIGVCVGMGREATAVLSTGFALAILALIPRLEHFITRRPLDGKPGP